MPESIKRGFQRKAKGAHDNFVLSEEAEEQINDCLLYTSDAADE